ISREDILTYLASSLIIDGVEIDNGMIIPEMTSSNGLGGINGIFAQMFGHRMGLPSFSNNKEGMPAAGGWCLMDTGAMALGYKTRGYVPTHPCIWSKIELGWIEPLEITSDTTLDIAATHINSGLPRGVKVPISSEEYLLIENRNRYASRDSLTSAVYSDSDSSGVWISVDHYDAYIPGSGILVWHVNERIISENRAAGTTNDDPYRRGLDLLEADGRQDIGAYIGWGDPRVAYTEGHENDTYKSDGVNILSPYTNPHSGSMWGGNSGITIEVNTASGDTMNVSIRFNNYMKGFPLSTGTQGIITAADMNDDGVDELIVSGKDNINHYLNVLGANGNILLDTPSIGHSSTVISENGKYDGIIPIDGTNFTLFRMEDDKFEPSTTFMNALGPYAIKFEGNTVTTRSGSNEDIVLVFTRNIDNTTGSTVSSYISSIRNVSENITIQTEVVFPDTVHIKSFSAVDDFIAALGENNTLYLGHLSDESLTPYPVDAKNSYGPILSDLNRDNEYETIISAELSLFIYQSDGTYDKAYFPDNSIGSPIAADIDSDGYPEIIQCTENGVYAFRHDGIPVSGFPFHVPPGDNDEHITSPPVVADLDDDGRPDIAFATSNMRLVSYDPSGILTPGFPIALSGEVVHSPCIFRRAAPDSIAIAYITTDGKIAAYDLQTAIDDDLYIWPMWKGGPKLNSALLNSKITSKVQTTAPFEAFCYPNPITGETGTFRIIPSGKTDCTITLYTAEGLKVFERYVSEQDIIPGLPHEEKMDVSGLASGLYIAKIMTRQKTVYYKLGVLK
ncbi:MAG: T9SS type A sorting domain-containing protein, partial [Candidatus Latescibacteria bacterium]|nr:T9SS type A sorting domain-containing protein [Candidatus Latescibacterota bacterium]